MFFSSSFLLSQFNLQAQNKDTTEKKAIYLQMSNVCLQLRLNLKTEPVLAGRGRRFLFQSEMMRLKKDSVSLAPLYIVWNTYNEKAIRYVRMHGSLNFAQGGSFADVVWAIKIME